jgi:hypothetical protein
MANELPLEITKWADMRNRFFKQIELVETNIEIFDTQVKNTKLIVDIADKEIDILELKIKSVEELINEVINSVDVEPTAKEYLMLIAEKLEINVKYNSEEEN